MHANFHLAREPVDLMISTNAPEGILDFVKRDITWEWV